MLSNRKKKFLSLAMKVAENSELRHKHGTVLVKSGRVISVGVNKQRNHPSVVTPGREKTECGIHAEIVAINNAGDNVKGAILFVARVNKKGMPLLSKPCPMCQKTIDNSGIKEVVWTQ